MSGTRTSGRDRGFVAEHRGGPLTPEQHRQLMRWALACIGHALPLATAPLDERLRAALATAQAWERGEVKTGDAMRASLAAHAAARSLTHPVDIALARGVGQTVATAHMSDHALGGALYGLKAVDAAGGDLDAERHWQRAQLPTEIEALVLRALKDKERHFRL